MMCRLKVETRAVLRRSIGAHAALAELRQAARLIPYERMLVDTKPLLEARASSEIENVVPPTDRVFPQDDAEERADPATKEAIRYGHAQMESFASPARPIGTRTAETICSRIRGIDLRVRREPGTELSDETTGKVIYTPPEGEDRLRALLGNWERFFHEPSEMDPLVRMTIGHCRFEAIHPFPDANGRTGRIPNSLYLVQQDLLTLPILYLSRFIIARKSEYYRKMLAVSRDGEREPWLLDMLEAVEDTSRWTTARIAAIRELADHTADFVRSAKPKIYSRALIDVISAQPYCRIANLVDPGIAKRQTASVHLKELAAIGVLDGRKVGREKLFLHPRLMTLLTTEDDAPLL